MGRTGCAASPRKALQVREYSDENRDPEGSHSYAGDGKLQPAEPQQKHNETCPTSSKGHRLFERFQFAMDLIAKMEAGRQEERVLSTCELQVVEREHKIRELDLLQKVGLLQGETEARESMLTAANASVKELQQKLQAVTAEGHVLTQRVADLAEALSISQAEVEREAVLSKELESKLAEECTRRDRAEAKRHLFWEQFQAALHAAQKSQGTVADLNTLAVAERQMWDKERARARSSWEGERARLEASNAEAMAELQRLQGELEGLERSRDAERRRLREERSSLEEAGRRETLALRQAWDEERAELRAAWQQETEFQKRVQAEELEVLRRAREEALEGMRRGNEEEAGRLSQEHEEEVEGLRRASKEEVGRLRRAQEQEVEETKRAGEEEVGRLRLFMAEELERLKGAWEQRELLREEERAALAVAHEAEREAMGRRLEDEHLAMEQSHEHQLAELRAAHERATAGVQEALEAERTSLLEMQGAWEEQREEMLRASEGERAAREAAAAEEAALSRRAFAEECEALRAEHALKTKRQAAEHARETAQQLADLRAELERESGELRLASERQVAELREEFERERGELRCASEQQVEAMRARFERQAMELLQVAERQEASSAEAAALKARVQMVGLMFATWWEAEGKVEAAGASRAAAEDRQAEVAQELASCRAWAAAQALAFCHVAQNMREELKAVQLRLQEAGDHALVLRAELGAARRQVAELREREVAARVAGEAAVTGAVRAVEDEAGERARRLEGQLDALREEIRQLQVRSSQLEQEKQVAAQEAQQRALEAERATQQDKEAALAQAESSWRAKCHAAAAAVQRIEESYARTVEEVAQVCTFADLDSQVNCSREAELEAANQALREAVDRLEASWQQSKKDIEALERAAARHLARKEELSKANSELLSQADTGRQEAERLQAALAAATCQLAERAAVMERIQAWRAAATEGMRALAQMAGGRAEANEVAGTGPQAAPKGEADLTSREIEVGSGQVESVGGLTGLLAGLTARWQETSRQAAQGEQACKGLQRALVDQGEATEAHRQETRRQLVQKEELITELIVALEKAKQELRELQLSAQGAEEARESASKALDARERALLALQEDAREAREAASKALETRERAVLSLQEEVRRARQEVGEGATRLAAAVRAAEEADARCLLLKREAEVASELTRRQGCQLETLEGECQAAKRELLARDSRAGQLAEELAAHKKAREELMRSRDEIVARKEREVAQEREEATRWLAESRRKRELVARLEAEAVRAREERGAERERLERKWSQLERQVAALDETVQRAHHELAALHAEKAALETALHKKQKEQGEAASQLRALQQREAVVRTNLVKAEREVSLLGDECDELRGLLRTVAEAFEYHSSSIFNLRGMTKLAATIKERVEDSSGSPLACLKEGQKEMVESIKC